MGWVPLTFSTALFLWLGLHWWITSHRAKLARDGSPIRIIVTGSRGKSGTVRLVHSVLSHSGIPTYAKITGAVAEEIQVDGDSRQTIRIGPISATEMLAALRRGSKENAQALVFECMAVAPKLISFVVNEVVKPTIVVIPTIRLDHLEDEGHDLGEITKNVVAPLLGFKTLITGDTDVRVLQPLRKLAREHGFRLIEARVHESQPEVYEQHPVNVAIALAIAAEVGVSHETARTAILGATREPDAGIGWWLAHHGKKTFIADLGSANDVQSAGEAISSVRAYLGHNMPIIAVVANRWDRPLRGRSFVASVAHSPGSLPVALSGDAYPQSRGALSRLGTDHSRVRRLHAWQVLSMKSIERLLNEWQSEEPEAAILLLENMHSPAVRLLRSHVSKIGTPVFHDRSGGVNK